MTPLAIKSLARAWVMASVFTINSSRVTFFSWGHRLCHIWRVNATHYRPKGSVPGFRIALSFKLFRQYHLLGRIAVGRVCGVKPADDRGIAVEPAPYFL